MIRRFSWIFTYTVFPRSVPFMRTRKTRGPNGKPIKAMENVTRNSKIFVSCIINILHVAIQNQVLVCGMSGFHLLSKLRIIELCALSPFLVVCKIINSRGWRTNYVFIWSFFYLITYITGWLKFCGIMYYVGPNSFLSASFLDMVPYALMCALPSSFKQLYLFFFLFSFGGYYSWTMREVAARRALSCLMSLKVWVVRRI